MISFPIFSRKKIISLNYYHEKGLFSFRATTARVKNQKSRYPQQGVFSDVLAIFWFIFLDKDPPGIQHTSSAMFRISLGMEAGK